MSYELATIERAWWNAIYMSYMSYEDMTYPRNVLYATTKVLHIYIYPHNWLYRVFT